MKTRKTAGLDMKYGMSNTGHALSVFTYHTLRHYYLQKICDRRGVFAAQISGRHKNLRSTERYLTTSMVAKQDIVNEVFNIQDGKESHEMKMLRSEISELKKIMMESVVLNSGHPNHIRNRKIIIEESEMRLQNRALHESRNLRRDKPATDERKKVVSSFEL